MTKKRKRKPSKRAKLKLRAMASTEPDLHNTQTHTDFEGKSKVVREEPVILSHSDPERTPASEASSSTRAASLATEAEGSLDMARKLKIDNLNAKSKRIVKHIRKKRRTNHPEAQVEGECDKASKTSVGHEEKEKTENYEEMMKGASSMSNCEETDRALEKTIKRKMSLLRGCSQATSTKKLIIHWKNMKTYAETEVQEKKAMDKIRHYEDRLKLILEERKAKTYLWKPPPIGTLKMNVDASWNVKEKHAGLAFIARDHLGDWKEGGWMKTFAKKSDLAELSAIRVALTHARDRGWTSVIISSDCLEAVKSIMGDKGLSPDVGSIVDECRELRQQCSDALIKFEGRETNVAADRLAYYAQRCRSHKLQEKLVLLSRPPLSISNILKLDVLDNVLINNAGNSIPTNELVGSQKKKKKKRKTKKQN